MHLKSIRIIFFSVCSVSLMLFMIFLGCLCSSLLQKSTVCFSSDFVIAPPSPPSPPPPPLFTHLCVAMKSYWIFFPILFVLASFPNFLVVYFHLSQGFLPLYLLISFEHFPFPSILRPRYSKYST